MLFSPDELGEREFRLLRDVVDDEMPGEPSVCVAMVGRKTKRERRDSKE